MTARGGLILFAALLAGGCTVAPQGEDYIAARSDMLREAAALAPPGRVLLMGDSISEEMDRIDLCGQPVFNAGVSGATLHDVAQLAPDLAEALRPSRILLAIGTNDADAHDPRPVEAWEAEYRALIARLSGYPVLLVAVPELETAKDVDHEYSAAHVAALNAALRRIASDLKLPLTEPIAMDTVDGVHPSRTGAAQWRAVVERGC